MDKKIWVQIACDEIQSYLEDMETVKRLEERIQENKEAIVSLRSAKLDGIAVKGGKSSREDWMIGLMSENDLARTQITLIRKRINRVKKGLAVMEEWERDILLRMSATQYGDGTVEDLCEKYNVEKSQLYRMKQAALIKYKNAQWGRE